MALSAHWFHRPRGTPLQVVPRKFLFRPGANPGEFSTHYFGLGVVAQGHKGRLARVGNDLHWEVAFICDGLGCFKASGTYYAYAGGFRSSPCLFPQ